MTAREELLAEATRVLETFDAPASRGLQGFAGVSRDGERVIVRVGYEFDDPAASVEVSVLTTQREDAARRSYHMHRQGEGLSSHVINVPGESTDHRELTGDVAYRMLSRLRQVQRWSARP